MKDQTKSKGNAFNRLNKKTIDQTLKSLLIIVLASLAIVPSAHAKGAGTSGGLTLLEPFGARPAALGEAFSAATNDIAAFGYNPASLRSLNTGQASFMYQNGL